MEGCFQVKLSSAEIFVLSALLGYESALGIEDTTLVDEGAEIKKRVRQIVRKLERKKLIRYDLDGTLYILPELRKGVSCVCVAETAALFSTNLKSGKKAVFYVLCKEGTVTILERVGEEKYQLCVGDGLSIDAIIPKQIMTAKHIPLAEQMPFEAARYVRNQIESFDHEAAQGKIADHVKDHEMIETIAKILSGTCGFMSLRIDRRGKSLYKTVYNSLMAAVDDCVILLRSDSANVLHFEATGPDSVVEKIGAHLNLSMNRGAV